VKVPFFPYADLFAEDEQAYVDIFRDVCGRGAFILQKEVEEFEQSLCELTGSKYALGVANATDAITMGMMAADFPAGGEVIIASHTMIATASGIHFAGGIPVPVDCGEDHLIDPAAIEAAITPKTKAIMPTQLNGRVANMDAVMQLADEHNLQVFEDSAQALGAKYAGRSAGTFGEAGCISFYPAKTMGCFGDGGALFCQDEAVFKKAKTIRDHGRNAENQIELWGINSRLDNLQAAIMLHKMKKYEGWIARRREIASLYDNYLSDLPQLKLPPKPYDGTHFDIFQNYEIEAERRDALKESLAANGIGTLVQWSGVAVHQCTLLGFDQELPKTDLLFEKMLMIPMHHLLSDAEVEHVAKHIIKFYQN